MHRTLIYIMVEYSGYKIFCYCKKKNHLKPEAGMNKKEAGKRNII